MSPLLGYFLPGAALRYVQGGSPAHVRRESSRDFVNSVRLNGLLLADGFVRTGH